MLLFTHLSINYSTKFYRIQYNITCMQTNKGVDMVSTVNTCFNFIYAILHAIRDKSKVVGNVVSIEDSHNMK